MSESTPNSDASRRDFIKKSSIVVGGAWAGGLGVNRAAYAAPVAGSDEIKIGLIGCGGRGTGAAANTLRSNDGVSIVAMADAFSERLEASHNRIIKQFGPRVNVPQERRYVGFDGYKKIMDDKEIDMVILATSPGFRPMHFEAAVAAGKHVFMEKPVAVDAAGVRTVLAAAKEAKKKRLGVGVGLQRHHQQTYIETIKRLQDGAIGDILFTRVYWNGGGVWVRGRKPNETEMEYQMRNWYYFNWLCGDHITEQHIHNLDVSNWLLGGHPVKAQGMGGREVRNGKDHGEIFDHHYVEYTYENGAKMFSHCRHIRGCWNSVSEHAHGTNGTSNIGRAQINVKNGESWKFRGSSPNPYDVEHADLVASIRAGKPYNEAEYGAHSTMTSILGRMATYSGKELTWDQAIHSKINPRPDGYTFDSTPPTLPDLHGNYPIAVPGVTQVVLPADSKES